MTSIKVELSETPGDVWYADHVLLIAHAIGGPLVIHYLKDGERTNVFNAEDWIGYTVKKVKKK